MSGQRLSIAFFLALRSIQNGNRFTLFLTITIMALVFVNLVFLPSIISGVIVNYDAQSIDYAFGNLVIEPKEEETYIFNVSSLTHKIDQIPDITGTSPRIQVGATYAYRGKTLSGVLVGLVPTKDEQVTKIQTKLKDGEFITDQDTDSIVLGSTLAGNQDKARDKSDSLGGPAVGDYVEVTFKNGVVRNMRVKGILSSGVYNIDQYGFVTLKEMGQVLGIPDRATSVLVKTSENGQEEREKILLMEYGVREQVRTYQEKASSAVKDAVTAFGIINGISTAVSLVIAMVVTFIVVYINTINKRRQIGILKAIGIHKNTIVLSYLFQVLFMATWGCILGLILAFLLITYLNIHPLVFPGGAVYPMVEAGPFIRSMILLYLVSLVSGFAPSYQTSKEPILDAIRGSA